MEAGGKKRKVGGGRHATGVGLRPKRKITINSLASLLIAGAGLSLALIGCTWSRGAEVRYRVSYTLNDNGVARSASGVWSNTVQPALIPLASKYKGEFHGEAIPLLLPKRGVLLLMPLGDAGPGINAGTMVRRLFSHLTSASSSDSVGITAQIANMVGRSTPIQCKRYSIPQPRREPEAVAGSLCLNFVFVSNPKDQSTLRRVAVEDGKFESLQGVRLVNARVTIARDPITRGLEQLLPWITAAQEYWRGRLITAEGRANYAYEFIYIKT